ncbi:acetyltransferase [Proteiniborus sp. DW1]|uniref:GNAT family N-acetyltransferase n=1 Tax=Proteiniborus sp. DW1 TaxID=1889883 RepID=UPI00092DF979|nr:GNAT family N-acetyltransferase [Proteiniborus sp. DW1]SCG82318.1 acetyltransferase [Proteiniborus sp. DW1]
MINYTIEKGTREELNYIDDEIIKYNSEKVPFLQEPSFISINRVMKDDEGNIIAGIIGLLYCWKCLYIDILWVKEEYRKEGYGSILLKEVENVAKEQGCYLVHLDTFDFQAKDFYIKQGYEIFGELSDCPINHTRYFMKKNL